MQRPMKTRALTEGALFAVLTALLALVGIYIPPLSLITNMVWTLPVIIVVIRNDIRTGILTTIVAGILVFMLSDPVSAALLFLQFGAVGITYGIFFKKQASPAKTLFYGTLVALISTVLSFSFSLTVAGINLQQWKNELQASIGPTMEIYRSLGLLDKMRASGMTEEQIKNTFQTYISWMEMLLPGIVVLASMFSAFINFVVARYLLRKLSYQVPEMPPFTHWRMPWYFIWGIILGLASLLAGQQYGIVWLANAGKNILYIYFPLLLVFGMSVVVYYFKSENILPIFKAIAVFLLIINLPLAVIIILSIGLFDPVLDYRKLERRI